MPTLATVAGMAILIYRNLAQRLKPLRKIED
jgi:hypothetical protein